MLLLLTPLAWSPLQASIDTLRVMIDDGNDVPAAFRATTKKLQDVGSVGIRLDNTWIYKSKIQKWVVRKLPVPSANLEASNLDYRYGRIQLLKTYNCYEVIIL